MGLDMFACVCLYTEVSKHAQQDHIEHTAVHVPPGTIWSVAFATDASRPSAKAFLKSCIMTAGNEGRQTAGKPGHKDYT